MECVVGFDEDELLVAEVLVSLSDTILKAEASRVSRSQPCWGVRKKRSAIFAAQSDGGEPLPTAALEERGAAAAAAAPAKAEVDSPATPLSFPRSESDEKLNPSKGTSRKRKREELLQTLKDCTERRDFLRGEIEAVRLHYDSLKSFNSELKELLVRHEIGTPPQQQLGISHHTTANSNNTASLNPTLTLEIGQPDAVHQTSFPVPHDQQPSVSDGAASQPHHSEVKMAPSPASASPHPPYVLDLNVAAWESGDVDAPHSLDLSLCIIADERARAAEARKRRRELQRSKGNNYAASRRKMMLLLR